MKIVQTDKDVAASLTHNFTNMGIFSTIISLSCPGDDSIKIIGDGHINVKMWDIDHDKEENGKLYLAPTEYDCIAILNHIDKSIQLNGWDTAVLIHCDAGISRSTAVTLGVLWHLSSKFFTNTVDNIILEQYIRARKEFCASLLFTEFGGIHLKWYAEGRNLLKFVKPNTAILTNYRKILKYFPW